MTSGEISFDVRAQDLGRAVEDRFWTKTMGWIMLYYMVTSPGYCIGTVAMFWKWWFILGVILLAAIPIPFFIYFVIERERASHRQFIMYVDSDDIYFKTQDSSSN